MRCLCTLYGSTDQYAHASSRLLCDVSHSSGFDRSLYADASMETQSNKW